MSISSASTVWLPLAAFTAATASFSFAPRPAMTTVAPRRASSSHIGLPIAPAAPVTNTVLPSIVPM